MYIHIKIIINIIHVTRIVHMGDYYTLNENDKLNIQNLFQNIIHNNKSQSVQKYKDHNFDVFKFKFNGIESKK